MAGLFGVVVKLINSIGLGILYVLFGAKAKIEGLRGVRLTLGSLGLGLLVGTIIYLWSSKPPPTQAAGVKAVLCFAVSPLAAYAATWIMESIRTELE